MAKIKNIFKSEEPVEQSEEVVQKNKPVEQEVDQPDPNRAQSWFTSK